MGIFYKAQWKLNSWKCSCIIQYPSHTWKPQRTVTGCACCLNQKTAHFKMDFKYTIGNWKDEQKSLLHFWWVGTHFMRGFIYNLVSFIVSPHQIPSLRQSWGLVNFSKSKKNTKIKVVTCFVRFFVARTLPKRLCLLSLLMGCKLVANILVQNQFSFTFTLFTKPHFAHLMVFLSRPYLR